jgi:hypothetical protein
LHSIESTTEATPAGDTGFTAAGIYMFVADSSEKENKKHTLISL